MSFTIINIIDVDGKWLVPPIIPNTEGYESTDRWDALDWANHQAHEYEKKTKRIKIPVIQGEYDLQRCRVQLGDKAVRRLELAPFENHKMPVYNIRFISMPRTQWERAGLSAVTALHYGVYFGIVIHKGKWASVCTSQVRSTDNPQSLAWSNLSVQRMKAEYEFPKNKYMPDDEPTPPPPAPTLSSNTYTSITDSVAELNEAIKRMGADMARAAPPTQRSLIMDDPTTGETISEESYTAWFQRTRGGLNNRQQAFFRPFQAGQTAGRLGYWIPRNMSNMSEEDFPDNPTPVEPHEEPTPLAFPEVDYTRLYNAYEPRWDEWTTHYTGGWDATAREEHPTVLRRWEDRREDFARIAEDAVNQPNITPEIEVNHGSPHPGFNLTDFTDPQGVVHRLIDDGSINGTWELDQPEENTTDEE